MKVGKRGENWRKTGGKPTDRQECERAEWKTSGQGGHAGRAVNVVKVATGQQQGWLLCSALARSFPTPSAVSRKCRKIDEKQSIKNINSTHTKKKARHTEEKQEEQKNDERQTCATRIMDSGSERDGKSGTLLWVLCAHKTFLYPAGQRVVVGVGIFPRGGGGL